MKRFVIITLTALVLGTSSPADAKDTPPKELLYTALDDIRRSEAYYDKVLDAFGRTLPFSWIVRQKRRQQKRVIKLIQKSGYKVPQQLWKEDQIKVPETKSGACSGAADHELRNSAIYEQALERIKSGKARTLFRRLHRRSRYKHLPAFERCIGA